MCIRDSSWRPRSREGARSRSSPPTRACEARMATRTRREEGGTPRMATRTARETPPTPRRRRPPPGQASTPRDPRGGGPRPRAPARPTRTRRRSWKRAARAVLGVDGTGRRQKREEPSFATIGIRGIGARREIASSRDCRRVVNRESLSVGGSGRVESRRYKRIVVSSRTKCLAPTSPSCP